MPAPNSLLRYFPPDATANKEIVKSPNIFSTIPTPVAKLWDASACTNVKVWNWPKVFASKLQHT